MLPTSLQKLLQETEYPPQTPDLMMTKTSKVVMIVDTVSPTPFALLRRANHFEYRDTDKALREFASADDPIQALSDECRRVLKSISAANQSQVSSSKHSTSLRDASWSRFEDIGFSSPLEEEEDDESAFPQRKQPEPEALRNYGSSGDQDGNGGFDRPTTPSWADFLSSGFVDDDTSRSNLLLPPDKVLPPLNTETRQRSSQSHRPRLESDSHLQPGELASITAFDLDETFWWVWITSLAPEETSERKSAFGRCAVVETKIRGGRWLVMEELVAGAAPEPEEGAYIAEKKGFLSWTKSIGRRRSTGKRALDRSERNFSSFSVDKPSAGPEAQAKIQAKAAQLRAQESQQRLRASQSTTLPPVSNADEKRETVYQSNIGGEATSAMKWVKKYDKGAIKDAYMANTSAGKGLTLSLEDESANGNVNGKPLGSFMDDDISMTPPVKIKEAPLPETPKEEPADQVEAEKIEEPTPQPLEKEPTKIQEQPPTPPKEEPVAPPPVLAEPAVVIPASEKSANEVQKEKKPSGIKKLFSRKNRISMLPTSRSSSKLTEATPETQEPTTQAETSTPAVVHEVEEKKQSGPRADENNEPTFDPDMGDNSPVDPKDAADAKREFSRFDQGPLSDQPAFDPEDEEDDPNDATPPPISRKPLPKHAIETPEEKLTGSAGPGVQDRWAQIRKNAAERAAQRQAEEQIKHGINRTTTGDAEDDAEECKYSQKDSTTCTFY